MIEIAISSTTPSGTGTELTKTHLIDYSIKTKTVIDKDTAISGKPICNIISEEFEIEFDVLVQETGDYVADTTLGLTDLDYLRKWCVGYNAGTIGIKAWIRYPEGDYFLREWKGGVPSGLSIKVLKGFPNTVGATLYSVKFKLLVVDDLTADKTLYKW